MRKLLKRIGSVGQTVSPSVTRLKVTGVAPATPTANVLYSELIVKGWLETSGGGAWTIDADVNVSSITDNGVGDFTVNWATAFANANYAVIAMAILAAFMVIIEDTTTAKSTSLVRLKVFDSTPALADPTTGISLIAIGTQ